MTTNSTKIPSAAETTDWPSEGLEPVVNCPACNSDQREKLYEALTDRIFFCAPGNWTMFKCENCGSAYLDPTPSPDTIHLAYQSYYTHAAPKRSHTEELPPLRRFTRASANHYRNRRFGSNTKPASALGGLLIHLLPSYKQSLQRQLRHLPKVWTGARLLDVGFGNGEFLELAQEAGWEVTGADPDHATVEAAKQRGLAVRQGGIEAFSDEAGSFDAITLNHVIEHVHDPKGTIQQAFNLLKAGGCLYIDTPNIQAVSHLEYGKYWRGLEPPRHLTIFTWNALENLLIQSGFKELGRFPKTDIYPGLAAASRAIQNGGDPYKDYRISLKDLIKGRILSLKTFANYRNSEFVTLVATK